MWKSEAVKNVPVKNHTFRTFVINPTIHICQEEKISAKLGGKSEKREKLEKLEIACFHTISRFSNFHSCRYNYINTENALYFLNIP